MGLKLPALFAYTSTRMLLASLSTFALTVSLGPRFIKQLYALKIGHTVRISEVAVLAEQYTKSRNVPSMGGILFLTTMILSSLLWMDLSHSFTFLLLAGAVWMGGIGMVDDYLKIKRGKSKGLSARMKFSLQALFSACLALYLLAPTVTKSLPLQPPTAKEKNYELHEKSLLSTQEYALHYFIPFCKKPLVFSGVVASIFSFLFILFVLVGSTNAVNLTDGLDGLATGLALLVALVLALVAFLSNHVQIADYLNILYIEGSAEIGIFLSILIGACLGFLWFNGYPAQLFMGDTGSLALGGILGISAILLRREFLYAIVGGVFVLETASVILQVASFRLRNGKRIFLCAPLHHHFQMKGWHEAKIVLRFWMIGLALAIIALVSLKIQ